MREELFYLTRGERLWLWMRRRRWGRGEVEACWGVSKNQAVAWLASRAEATVPEVVLEEPIRDGETLAIMRRRSGMTLREVAEGMGLSHVTLIAREREHSTARCRRALRWWKARGYPLPPDAYPSRRR